jgi:hypothetical protein
MKIYMVEQRSDAWRHLRLGIPTASNFSKIVTPKKCELSKSAADYALRLVAERLLNMTSESSIENPWMERGTVMEADAARHYEFLHDVTTIPVGFITTDDGRMGCSPDRLVAGDQKVAVEIKCQAPHVHLNYLLNGTDDHYAAQIHGQILIAELERVDLFSYHPAMPAALIKTMPDDAYKAKLSAALSKFCDTLDDMHKRALALGAFQPLRRVTTPGMVREVTDINDELRRENERRFVKEGFTL